MKGGIRGAIRRTWQDEQLLWQLLLAGEGRPACSPAHAPRLVARGQPDPGQQVQRRLHLQASPAALGTLRRSQRVPPLLCMPSSPASLPPASGTSLKRPAAGAPPPPRRRLCRQRGGHHPGAERPG